MRKTCILLAFCLYTVSSFSQFKDKAAIDEIFADWDKMDAPGCALGIVQDGQMVYSTGYGIGDLEHDIEITPSSVFYIGSVSKQFVTFCVLLLEEQGKIDLDAKIQEYLPDFPEYGDPLTIRNFIHHTSGVRDYLTLMALKGRNYLDEIEPEEVYELIKAQAELNFTPGERYLYSNSCYFMLAMIVEEVAGESIRSFAEKNIFQPLGMKRTLFYDDNTDLIKNKVFSYQNSSDGEGFDNLIMRFDLVGSGGVYSCVEDLYLWDQNFYNNKLGKGGQAIIEKMQEEGLLNNGEGSGYAFALNVGTYKGLKTVSHGGALAGYRAELMRFPDQKTSVIILANRADANPTGMSYQVADVLLKDEFVEEPEKEARKEEPEIQESSEKFSLDQMAGKYELSPGVIAEISAEGDSLHVKQLWNNAEYNIYRTGNNIFEIPEQAGIQFVFSDLSDDFTQVLTVYQNGNVLKSKRLPEEEGAEVNLADYVGEYYSKEIDATYRIFLENDQLMVKVPQVNAMEVAVLKLDDLSAAGGYQMSVKRENDKVVGFELDAGRVQNLKFAKQ